MQRIGTLLQKISELAGNEQRSVIEIDLMLDYTKVLYADLLELRSRVLLNESLQAPPPSQEKAVIEPQEEDIELTEPAEESIQQPEQDIEEEDKSSEITDEQITLPEQEIIESPMPPPVKEIPVVTQVMQKDVRSFIGINDKYQFISELFSNNKDAYDEVLDEINMKDTYHEAEEWLEQKVEPQYNWDKESMTVQMFYSMLSQFFSSI